MAARTMCNNVADASVCELIGGFVVPAPRETNPPKCLA
jgi:hypothetical protein